MSFADWPANGATWLLLLVAASRRSPIWAAALAGPLAVQAACLLVTAGTSVTGFERLSSSGYASSVALLMVASIRPAFEAQAEVATREATLRAQVTVQREAAEAVRQDRLIRLAFLQRDVLPLLQDVADGALDLADPGVRNRCAAQSVTLRRALVDSLAVRDPLISEVQSVLDAAVRNGVTADLQVARPLGETSRELRAATRRALAAVLGELPPQIVTLTVLADDEHVEVFLPFRVHAARRPMLSTAASRFAGPTGWQATITFDETGADSTAHAGYLEIQWPTKHA